MHGGDGESAILARGVLAVGFEGADLRAAPLAELRAAGAGAIVLFGRNVSARETLCELITALRATSEIPPLIAIDQEGGSVARIRSGVAQIPSAMALGASNDPTLADGLGLLLGRDLARCGISVNFAPVADVASPNPGGAIGTRSYGDDPAAVAAFAIASARGLARGGVAPTFKHFPGHGATVDDSHRALPRISDAETVVRGRDLVPFARAIAQGVAPIVMTAHIIVDAFDGAHPATLSARVLTGILREELRFDGVIVTDCLEMDAIANGVGTVQGALAALAAGADLLLISHRLEIARDVVDAIVAAVADGRIPLARLREAYDRVLRLRTAYAVPRPYEGTVDDELPREAAGRAVTAIRGDLRLRAGKPVTVISFDDVRPAAAAVSGSASRESDATLSAALRRRGAKSEHMRVAREPDGDDITLLLEHVARLGDREFVLVTRNAYASTAARTAVARLLEITPDAIVIAAALPHDAMLWPEARRVACIYGDAPPAFEGCADVLTGRVAPGGRLPLALGAHAAVR